MRLTESSGDLSQISKLPDSQTDLATRDDGSSALQRAAEGADVGATDGFGWTAIHRAAWEGHGDVVALLERALEKESTSRIKGNANEDHQS